MRARRVYSILAGLLLASSVFGSALAPAAAQTTIAMYTVTDLGVLSGQGSSTAGAINALYRLRLKLPTRFMYDFMLYNQPEAEYTQAFQREFLEALTANPPPAFLITHHSWPDAEPKFQRLEAIPGLNAFLDAHYQRVVEKEKYHIYTLRHD